MIVSGQTAAAVAAQPTKHARTLVGADEIAIDGDDIYYTRSRKGRRGVELVRGSFADRSRTVIARYSGRRGQPSGLLAADGHVVFTLDDIEVETEELISDRSEVVRISRDGTQKEVLAAGSIDQPGVSFFDSGSESERDDCGTTVRAEAISETGIVVVKETTADRSSVRCGGRPNVDHVRAFAIFPNGSASEVFRTDLRLMITEKRNRDGSVEVTFGYDVPEPSIDSIAGGRVLYTVGKNYEVWVRDLAAQQSIGPYFSGKIPGRIFLWGSLDPEGRVAAMTARYEIKGRRGGFRKLIAGVFPQPGTTQGFVKYGAQAGLLFCGRRLLAFESKRVRELNPVTLAPRRTVIAKYSGLGNTFVPVCNEKRLVFSRSKKHAEVLTALELQPGAK